MADFRKIYQTAEDIKAAWPKPSAGAKPYLSAMLECNEVGAMYYADSVEEVVLRFLANAQSFRGEAARKLKEELKLQLASPRS